MQMTLFFFLTDTASSEIYTLSLHDALPIFPARTIGNRRGQSLPQCAVGSHADQAGGLDLVLRAQERGADGGDGVGQRSEEHTSELQSRGHLVCRLLLEKKKRRYIRSS